MDRILHRTSSIVAVTALLSFMKQSCSQAFWGWWKKKKNSLLKNTPSLTPSMGVYGTTPSCLGPEQLQVWHDWSQVKVESRGNLKSSIGCAGGRPFRASSLFDGLTWSERTLSSSLTSNTNQAMTFSSWSTGYSHTWSSVQNSIDQRTSSHPLPSFMLGFFNSSIRC